MARISTAEVGENAPPVMPYDTPIVVGCDDGYAEIKLAYLDGGQLRQFQIPSRVAVGTNLTTQTTGESSDEAYRADDMDYTVNEYLKSEDTRSRSYPVSALNRVLVHHALRRAGLGGMKVHIATGLPPRDYYHSGGINDRMISGKQRNLLSDITAANGAPMAKIVNHHVFSEGATALIDYCVDIDGNPIHEVTSPIAVVDIGGRTTDCLTVLPPGTQVSQARSGSKNIGVLDVADGVRSRLCEQYDIDLDDLSDQSVDDALHKGEVRLFGQVYPVQHVVEDASQEVAQKILHFVQSKFNSAADISTILCVGGGAALMRDAIVSQFPQAHVPEDPQFANARGMLKYILMSSRG